MKQLFLISLFLATCALARAAADGAVVIDVRTPEEYAQGHLAGASNIDVKDGGFEAKIKALDKEKTYKVYCRSGNRSAKAEKLMKGLGFQHVENVGSLQDAAKRLGKSIEGPAAKP